MSFALVLLVSFTSTYPYLIHPDTSRMSITISLRSCSRLGELLRRLGAFPLVPVVILPPFLAPQLLHHYT